MVEDGFMLMLCSGLVRIYDKEIIGHFILFFERWVFIVFREKGLLIEEEKKLLDETGCHNKLSLNVGFLKLIILIVFNAVDLSA